MNKKTLIIIISILLLIVAGVISLFLLKNPGTPISETLNNVLPFGSGGGDNMPLNNGLGNATTTLDENGKPLPNLFRISDAPVAGAVAFIKNGFTVVRYVDRATGHIYDINPVTLERTKITNTTRPKIYEAYFKPDGSRVLIRSLKNNSDVIENVSLSLTQPRSTSTDEFYLVSAVALRGDISEVATGSTTLYYVLKDTSSVVSSNYDGSSPRSIYTSAFKDWRLGYMGGNLLLWTKASASALGYAYSINTSTGGLTKLLGGQPGLTVVADRTGSNLVYSFNNSGRTDSYSMNIRTGNTNPVFPSTLAEKCVWSERSRGVLFCGIPQNTISTNEPDLWYQGMTHYQDQLWTFDTVNGISDVLAEPTKEFNIDMDVTNPQLAPDEDYLIFTNKNDLSLWALKLR